MKVIHVVVVWVCVVVFEKIFLVSMVAGRI